MLGLFRGVLPPQTFHITYKHSGGRDTDLVWNDMHCVPWVNFSEKISHNVYYQVSLLVCTVKVKLSLCLTKYHAIKMYWGGGGTAPRILDSGTRNR
jgi:hypothetical protein